MSAIPLILSTIARITRRTRSSDGEAMRFDITDDAPDNGHPESGEEWWQYNARTKR